MSKRGLNELRNELAAALAELQSKLPPEKLQPMPTRLMAKSKSAARTRS